MIAIFTYGTLMFDEVWRRVVRGHYTKSAAILPGYELRALRDEDFPAIIKTNSDDQVSGFIYAGIDDGDLLRLDAFEGDYYHRVTVTVFSNNDMVPAQTYILRDECISLLADRSWNAGEFKQLHLANFIKTGF